MKARKVTSREKQDLKHALLENINAYPFDWTNEIDGSMGEDAVEALTSWTVNEYENDVFSNEVSLEDWFSIGISVLVHHYDNVNYDTIEQKVRDSTNNYEEL